MSTIEMNEPGSRCNVCGADTTNRARCPNCRAINTAYVMSSRSGGVFVSVLGATLMILVGGGAALATRGLQTGDSLPTVIMWLGLTIAAGGLMWLIPLLVSVSRGATWFGAREK